MDPRSKRILKEIKDCQVKDNSGITVEMVDDNPYHLVGYFKGPDDTPYEDGDFHVDIQVPDSYPFQPLKMKFITRVYHPNISSQTGLICLDILGKEWSPVLTLKSTLISLQSLLCSPAPDDPQDAVVAKIYTTDREKFNKTARMWTKGIYKEAEGSNLSPAAAAGLAQNDVNKFTSMGFLENNVIEVLSALDYRGNNIQNISDDIVVEQLLS
ncbi:ubiquitin-conjugating enzyme e2-24 kda [Wallemia mellicola CBS 633.66]|uniref:Ubiquitin-conjugating enzyme E2 1 n=2 Tax=Wallemia mellicola TaxID=1708541 RepID=I4YCB4_WALMC|nr:ubiquitin-conjugating enzyme e2-24 kda [Wallemia mellicola CBS 633.66]EIM21606.1 ubiquitin-conjugating enzyme e2-24 kda [Wallemia mellicola CBS 633.66]TIC01436.1 ubiquitin-conjugating enzyme e2-24 kda [Wallemia mellicola]TIC30868.1 ubiquitin-conjugating enzyme e2-24 kda [Wallemia mellicola]TIC32984.1 ubiquitin-conjugating enzyme e2-24 kda [Wallemia mellicola]|eukprot:XP_006958301.1 ubiquitin-conjugating enzyme e2-24 kda [Wallemia mellicola CBS 633.66]